MDYKWDDNGWVLKNVSQPGYGLHKHAVSIQVMYQMGGPQPDQICLIFLGTGKRIYDAKKMAYPNNV